MERRPELVPALPRALLDGRAGRSEQERLLCALRRGWKDGAPRALSD